MDEIWVQAIDRHRAGRLEEALALYGQILTREPGNLEAHLRQGQLFNILGRFDEAAWAFSSVIRLAPGHAGAHAARALALHSLGRSAEALADARAAVGLNPGDPIAHFSLGLIGGGEAGLASFDQALTLNPDFTEAHLHRANTLFALERWEEALAGYDLVLRLAPGRAQAHYNRGKTLGELGCNAEAIAAYDQALALQPNYSEAWNNKGTMMLAEGRVEEALAAYDAAVTHAPDYAEAHNHRSMALLLTGRHHEGWREMEWRKRVAAPSGNWAGPEPEWTGREPIQGQTLLVHTEQGLGDTLQFCRYLALLMKQGARVILLCPQKLKALLSTLGGEVEVIGESDPLPGFDRQIALMSLPLIFDTDLANIPADIPYLSAQPERVELWRGRLGGQGFKIGVCWRGSALGSSIGKSFDPEAMAALADISGIRLISLQKGEAAPGWMEDLGEDFNSGDEAFLDTAAVMQSLDLVISTDTSVAHLAGALGRPVWLALKRVADWRWLRDRDDTPWYPGMRLFRQQKSGDWRSVFSKMQAELVHIIP